MTRANGSKGPGHPAGRGSWPARPALGVFSCAFRPGGYPVSVSGADEDAFSFDSSPTGRFGLAAVTERGRERDTAPIRAQGTPPPITAPVASQPTASMSSESELSTVTDVDATVVNPSSPFGGPSSPFGGPSSPFAGPSSPFG